MGKHLYAFVRGADDAPLRHFVGLPPEIAGDRPGPEPFPRPDVLIVTADPEDGVMLDRYTASGAVAGDTWHETEEYAKEQAGLEYGSAVVEWWEVPEGTPDPLAFALDRYRDQHGARP